jgi:hypothetical protein
VKSESLKSDDDDVEGQPRRFLAPVACVSCVGCQGGYVPLRRSCSMTLVGALISVFGRFLSNKLAKFCTSSLLMKMAILLPVSKKKKNNESEITIYATESD